LVSQPILLKRRPETSCSTSTLSGSVPRPAWFVIYTVGIVFYALDRLSYFHALWHLFVLAGSTSHYFAVLFYVAQPRT
jgi:predicted membrane channel-forming protein YqfA (hemolysin III family)